MDSFLNWSITRRLELHIIPWPFGIWLLAFTDRSNKSNARIDGLAKDLKLEGTELNIAFYIRRQVLGRKLLQPARAPYRGIVGMCTDFVKD
ncbi:MAG: hypothetical protein Q9172_003024 [Xanthocarpia lactea]